MPDTPNHPVQPFLDRWRHAGSSERANYALYLSELCDLLGVPRPMPASANHATDDYVFERRVTHEYLDGARTTNFIDLYRKGSFVLEAKQGAAVVAAEPFALSAPLPTSKGIGTRGSTTWATGMLKAKAQAENYARDLPVDHGWPPFLIVVDVG